MLITTLPGWNRRQALADRSVITYQLDGSGHRGTEAVKRLVEYAPASGGLALWMQHRDVDQSPVRSEWNIRGRRRKWLIANDGKTIFYGPDFEQLTLLMQTGLLAHQVLHVALLHSTREQALREQLGSVDGELYCVCADAIVNSSLSHLKWMELPDGSVTLDTLLSQVLGIEEPLDVSLNRWNTESLYREIDDRQWQGNAENQSGSNQQSSDSSTSAANQSTHGSGANGRAMSTSGAPDNSQQSAHTHKTDTSGSALQTSTSIASNCALDGERSRAARQLAANMIHDLLTPTDNMPENHADQAHRWSERLLRAHTADAEQSLMRQLLADNQPPSIAWEQVIRTRLQRALAQTADISWSRPARSWLANRGRTSSGKRMPWQPGTVSQRNCSRLCVMVDVSGSVESHLMQRFASEIERIMRVLRCDVQLVVGDCTVRYTCKLKAGGRQLRSIEFNGGGGTDFEPLIDAADRLRPDLGIVLTDLDGPAGDAPGWPILWVVPEEAGHRKEPFGDRIIMK